MKYPPVIKNYALPLLEFEFVHGVIGFDERTKMFSCYNVSSQVFVVVCAADIVLEGY